MRPGFYNDNINRDYPFIHLTTGTLPDSAVADFGCIMGAGSGFIEGEHTVKLYRIRRLDTVVEYEFTCDAPGLTDYVLRFTADTSDELYTTIHAVAVLAADTSAIDCALDCAVSCALPDETTCSGDHVWSGFLVIGKITELIAVLTHTTSVCGETTLDLYSKTFNIGVEPSVIVNISGSYVRSLSVANAERTRATAPEFCREYCWPFPLKDHYVNCECVTGPIRFVEGYNTCIVQNDLENSITINACLGGGKGEPCTEVPIFADEEPPTGRTTLNGALKCSEIIKTINGVGQRFFELLGGSGVTVTSVPEANKIIVDVNLHTLAVCTGDRDQSSVSSTAPNMDECSCGSSLSGG